MRRRITAGLWLLTALASGYGCAPLDVGQSPEMVWWTDNEAGDTSEWTRDGGGYTWTDQGGSLEVVTSPTRSGHYALAASVASPGTGIYSAALATRQGGLPLEAYYSAWYYVPEAAASTDYWLFFKFRSRTTASDAESAVDVWDLDFIPASGGGMGVALYHHSTGNWPNLANPPVPIGRWFQTEAFVRAAGDATGQLMVWFDGTLIFDVSGQSVMPSSYVEWSVGGVAEVISPAPATLYVDDAAISTERLGPGYPVFWRQ